MVYCAAVICSMCDIKLIKRPLKTGNETLTTVLHYIQQSTGNNAYANNARTLNNESTSTKINTFGKVYFRRRMIKRDETPKANDVQR